LRAKNYSDAIDMRATIDERVKDIADQARRSREFQVGDKVMVKLLSADRKLLRGRDRRLGL